jgi:flagellar protein FlaI
MPGIAPLPPLTRPGAQAARMPDAATIRARLARLDVHYGARRAASEKVSAQSELNHMRRALARGKRTVDVTYAVRSPFAFVQVRFDARAGEFQYVVHEPRLSDPEKATLADVRAKLESVIDREELPVAELGRFGDAPALQSHLLRKFEDVQRLYDITIPKDRKRVLYYYLQRDLVGLGKSDAVLRDPFIEDVSCNGPRVPLFVFHRVFGSTRTNVEYSDERELNRYILKLAQICGKHVSIYQPILDATLSDGSRVNLTLGTEVTRKGSTFTIRKFTQDPISPVDLIRLGSGSAHEFAYFWHLIENKRSILISGGTASGKTTLLNALAMFVRQEDKVVSIEDTPEVHLAHENWIQSVSRAGYGIGGGPDGKKAGSVTLFDLLVAALRQRPEYVLVGEVRGKEAFSLFQAISTGHAAMATVHAGTIEELLHRIENEPMNIPRPLVESLDVVAFPGQVLARGQRARRIRAVTEILEVEKSTGNLLTNEAFRWDPQSDAVRYMGRSFALERIGKSSGRGLDQVKAEVQRKEEVLDVLAKLGRTHYQEVTRTINDYYVEPEMVLARLRRDAGR